MTTDKALTPSYVSNDIKASQHSYSKKRARYIGCMQKALHDAYCIVHTLQTHV